MTSALSEPVRSVDPDPELGQQRADTLQVLAGEQVGRGQQGALEPRSCGRRKGIRRDRGLAGPDVALEEAQHRRRPGEVVADGVDGRDLVDCQLDRLADACADRLRQRRLHGEIGVRIDRHLGCRIADPLPAASHHPELERQELVKGQPAERSIAVREGRRVMSGLDRGRDRHQPFLGDDRGRQVLGIGEACLVERLADGRPEADRGKSCRQAVDRDDPSGMEQLGVVGDDLELGVVEGQAPPEMLDFARYDDLGADEQPALDEAPPEPGRIDAPGLVLESRDRPLGPASKTRFDPHIPDRGLRRDDGPIRRPAQVADLAHLAQVVVAARQVEEQVADGVEIELDPGSTQAPRRRRGRTAPVGSTAARPGRSVPVPGSSPWPRLLG